MSTPHAHPANWYPDPSGGQFLRYWDGHAWTSHTRPAPNAATPQPAMPTAALATVNAQPAAPMVLYPQNAMGMPAPIGVWRGPVDSRPFVQNMVDAVRVCIQKYAKFDGRAGRPEFWYAQLAMILAVIAVMFVVWIPVLGLLAGLALWVLGMAALVPSLAVTVRRLRDAGFYWAWIFLSLVPLGGIALVILCAQPSKHP